MEEPEVTTLSRYLLSVCVTVIELLVFLETRLIRLLISAFLNYRERSGPVRLPLRCSIEVTETNKSTLNLQSSEL